LPQSILNGRKESCPWSIVSGQLRVWSIRQCHRINALPWQFYVNCPLFFWVLCFCNFNLNTGSIPHRHANPKNLLFVLLATDNGLLTTDHVLRSQSPSLAGLCSYNHFLLISISLIVSIPFISGSMFVLCSKEKKWQFSSQSPSLAGLCSYPTEKLLLLKTVG
jgi:hypothetical protein